MLLQSQIRIIADLRFFMIDAIFFVMYSTSKKGRLHQKI